MLELLGFGKPSREQFARALMRHAAAHGFDEPMHFDAAGFRIIAGAEGNTVVNLVNLYPAYRDAGRSERSAWLAKCLAMFHSEELPTGFEAMRAHLLPVVRARSYVESFRQGAGADTIAVSERAFAVLGTDSVILLAYDRDDSMNILFDKQVEALGVPFATALDAALANLRDRSVEAFVRGPSGVAAAVWNDAYDSSRILLPDVIHRAGIADPVAMLPTRDQLLVASASNREALLAMLEMAQASHAQEGRTVSAAMFAFQGGSAQEYVPADAEVALQLANLKLHYLADDYASQKQLLDEANEKQGIDVFVASFLLMQRGDDDLFSLCTWSQDVDALLPRTDLVALTTFDEAGEAQLAGRVDWEQLVRVAGHLMQLQPDAYPERYRVTGFPDLAALRLR
jgi:uncharacterized protein YtpQ (UPF0354 family)